MEKISRIAFLLSIIGAVLILINGALIAFAGTPVIISVYPASSVGELQGFWGRVGFGIRGWVEGSWSFFWLFLAVVNLLSAVMLYIRPKAQRYWGNFVLVLSLFSIPIGGGFAIGLVLSIFGSATAIQWPKSFGETFLGKLLRAARLDSTVYDLIGKDPQHLKSGVSVIIFISLLSGLGIGLYTYNALFIKSPPSPDILSRILLQGETFMDITVLGTPASYIGIAIMRWVILSLILYLVGVRIAGADAQLGKVAGTVAFAYAPIGFQVFMPLFIPSESFLVGWPLILIFITDLWMVIALIYGIRRNLEMPTGRTVGVVLLAGSIYSLFNYLFLIPTLKIPGIQLSIQPVELILLLFSASTVLATLLGVFTKPEKLQ
jgi:hypothetical protein